MKMVRVHEGTHEALAEEKRPGESFDDLINRLLPEQDLAQVLEATG